MSIDLEQIEQKLKSDLSPMQYWEIMCDILAEIERSTIHPVKGNLIYRTENKKMSVKGFKGFKKGLICDPTGEKPFQYKEGETYETENIEMCEKGFHFCENPLDVLRFYPLVDEEGNEVEYARVEALGKTICKENKSCTQKIRIGEKISFENLIDAAVKLSQGEGEECSSSKFARIGSSKDYARISSSKDYARISSSGWGARISSSGEEVIIGSSGYGAIIHSSGICARISSSGNSANISSSGGYTKIYSSGTFVNIESSGYGTVIRSSGYGTSISSSGICTIVDSFGKNSIVCCAGQYSQVSAKIGSWITLTEWGGDGGEYRPICVKTEYVDGERIKENVYYKLEGGKFVEV